MAKGKKSARTNGPTDQRVFVPVTEMPKKRAKPERAVPAQAGPGAHLAVLDPIPASAANDPIGFADAHLLSLVPQAAKEKEWQLKFGNDATRDRVASEVLAIKGIAAKRDSAPVVQPAITLVMAGPNPFATRVLPSVEARVLPSAGVRTAEALTHSSGDVTVDGASDKDGTK